LYNWLFAFEQTPPAAKTPPCAVQSAEKSPLRMAALGNVRETGVENA
jgi:hypothetical protein